MDISPLQHDSSVAHRKRSDLANRTGGLVTFALTFGVLLLTVIAAWTTVGPAA